MDALLESLLCPDRYATVYCMNKERARLECQGDCELSGEKGSKKDATPRALNFKLKIIPILQALFEALKMDTAGQFLELGYLSPYHSVETAHKLFRPPR